MTARRFAVTALMGALALVWSGGTAFAQAITPPTATPGGAQLYELTENMRLLSKKHPRRTATSELIGVAARGTPLCTEDMIAKAATDIAAAAVVDPSIVPFDPNTVTQCTINATGSDNVSLITGGGTLQGRFTVVVQGDNQFDSPEFVVVRGNFRGMIQFTPFLYGLASGTFTSDAGQRVPFTGTFRVPFDLPLGPNFALVAFYVDAPPPGVIAPGACFGDLTALQHATTQAGMVAALTSAAGHCVPVKGGEFAGGWPTVRFDFSF